MAQINNLLDTSWHSQELSQVILGLMTHERGLSDQEAETRLKSVGPNTIQKASPESRWAIVWRQINNPLIYVMLASTAFALFMQEYADGFVVLGAVVLNTIIGYLQEQGAGQAVAALTMLVPESTTVVRQGIKRVIPVELLVPGDVVVLQSGDKVPADMRLISIKGFRVDESALTGESVSAEKALKPVSSEASLGDRTNMVFGGTLVTTGIASAVVTGTGAKTELGKISTLLRETFHAETPLTHSLNQLSRTLTIVITIVSVILIIIGMLRGYTFLEATLAAISLAVAAIPEGLPAVITIALAVGVQRMAKQKAVVRRLPAVETLGSTTVICTDKTGTVTRNEMVVREVWTPATGITLTGEGYDPKGTILSEGLAVDRAHPSVHQVLLASVLCNDSSLHTEQKEDKTVWSVVGDPTEGALITAGEKIGIKFKEVHEAYPRTDVIPFEPEYKFMATRHQNFVFLKGAPETILARCQTDASDSSSSTQAIQEMRRMASQGMRVLAFAECEHTSKKDLTEDDVRSGLRFLGLVGMIDPPRTEVIQAIQTCHRAGIVVKMITGDHPETASAIGREVGILGEGSGHTKGNERVVTGHEIQQLSDEELNKVVLTTNVFARVAPAHKLRLVQSLQANGHIVTMTGDGVNDAPALKQANIGVAMGITGTAVAKGAADIILIDDNFASIAKAVREGRRVYDNLVKSLAFILPTSIGEAGIILFAVFFLPFESGVPVLPIRPVQILWINLVAAISLALPLAFEAMEPQLMSRAPRDPKAPILRGFINFRILLVSIIMTVSGIGLFLMEYHERLAAGAASQIALGQAQTMAVTAIVLMQVFYLITCRSFQHSIFKIGVFANPFVLLGIVLTVLLQCLFIYVPWMNKIFGSQPIGMEEWMKAILVGLTLLPFIAFEKFWRSRVRSLTQHKN